MSYTKKFNALPESEKKLSPEWTMSQTDAENLATPANGRQMKISAATKEAIKGTGLEQEPRITEVEKHDPFNTPPRTPSGDHDRKGTSDASSSSDKWSSTQNTTSDMRNKAAEAYDDAGLKWQPCKKLNEPTAKHATNNEQSPSSPSAMRLPVSSPSTLSMVPLVN